MSSTSITTTQLHANMSAEPSSTSINLSARAQPTVTSSPLLSLPLELRLQIFAHTLSLTPRLKPSFPTDTNEKRHLFYDHVENSLLLVSRQIYQEARLLPFQSNTFIFAKTYGSSIVSAIKLLEKLLDWQREAVRSVEIAVVGREIVEGWRREAGWEAAVRLLSSSKVEARVRIQEGDVWIGNGAEATACWLPNGGNVGLVAGIGWVALDESMVPENPKWGDVRPVVGTGSGGWVQKLLQAGVPESVRLEFCWS
ncbi:hypothetical protein HO173_009780 [Letharia columbiana]|uniref:Uncharacterized protein n=1 Tax=Letharia columbiana TaxID=112416 RepID=A0A8H6FNR5_9LECA|nr:uncharacterized protein HO173_009780 [Letharia columbiana]KAF6231943.1 hypothetical protein HO173_009780 [Letharia columbiana]